MARPRTSPLVRFSNKYAVDPDTNCWLWQVHIPKLGYGAFRFDPKCPRSIGAHRASWILFRGTIPDGSFVCHKCDVRHCVNPDHLFLGDAFANMRDAAAKGRMDWKPGAAPRRLPRGELHSQAKVTEHQVRAIRASKASGIVLAKFYNITPKQISRIRRRETWTHI